MGEGRWKGIHMFVEIVSKVKVAQRGREEVDSLVKITK